MLGKSSLGQARLWSAPAPGTHSAQRPAGGRKVQDQGHDPLAGRQLATPVVPGHRLADGPGQSQLLAHRLLHRSHSHHQWCLQTRGLRDLVGTVLPAYRRLLARNSYGSLRHMRKARTGRWATGRQSSGLPRNQGTTITSTASAPRSTSARSQKFLPIVGRRWHGGTGKTQASVSIQAKSVATRRRSSWRDPVKGVWSQLPRWSAKES